jgi:hypothetical protein
MASREPRREARQDERARLAQPQQQARPPQPMVKVQPPKLSPPKKALHDTAKAEDEVRKGAAVAKEISKKVALPAVQSAPRESAPQSPAMKTEARQEAPVVKESRGLARRIAARKEKVGAGPSAKEEKPVAMEERPQQAPEHAPPSAMPPSGLKKAWNSFLGLIGFSRRQGPTQGEPAKSEPKEQKAKAAVTQLNVSSDGMAQGAPPPDDGSGRGMGAPDFDKVRIAPFDPDIRLGPQLPGIGARNALEAQRVITGNRGTLTAYEARVRELMRQHPGAFTPAKRITIGKEEVSICNPMLIGRDVRTAREDLAVPIYVTTGGTTRLVMCYRSQSQGTWRRFAGCDDERGHYYKGPEADSESLQDLDWRIQKEIDSLPGALRPAVLPKISLGDFGPKPADGKNAPMLVVAMENALQSSALNGAPQLDLSKPESLPSKVVDSWMVGSDGDFYGRHANMLLESADGRYLYGVAATDLGMFVQFVHDREAPAVGPGGSPSRGVVIPEKEGWLLTPIIEYSIQTGDVMGRRLSKAQTRKTVVAGGARSYVLGVHSSSGSPLFRIDNAISPVYALLRSGDFRGAETFLGDIKSGKKPLASDERPQSLQMDKVAALSEERYKKLKEAYAAHASRAASDEEIMKRYSVGRRDVMVFERYEESGRDALVEDRRFKKMVSGRVASIERAIGSLGNPLDAEGAAKVVRDQRLGGRVAEAVAKLAGVGDAAQRKKILEEAVKESLRESISEDSATRLDERLHWQATLWAQAEIATGRA